MQNNNNSSSNNNTLNRQRSNGKGKFLTRSHAMRESTSPPRTPTPRSGNLAPSVAISEHQQQLSSTIKNENSNRNPSTSPITVNSQQQPPQSSTNLFATNGNISVTQLDLEFPKLTPPKSKSPRNNSEMASKMQANSETSPADDCSSTVISNRGGEKEKSPTASNNSASNGPVSSSSNTGVATPLSPPILSNSRLSEPVATAQQPDEKDERKNPSLSGRWQCNRSVSPVATISNTAPPSSSCQSSPVTQNAVGATSSLSPTSNESMSKATSIDVPKITKTPVNAMCTIRVSVATDQQRSSNELNATDSKDKSIEEPNETVNRKNRNNPNIKGGKTPRPKHGAFSLDLAGNHLTSDYTAQDCSGGAGDHFTDQNGVDLLQFFKITLNKNTKDRSMLLRIEKELASLTQDESRDVIRFPTMSSYNRMLIHRVAAWFGMEHNVDGALQCVIVGTTKTTRIPEIRFKSLLSDTFTDEPLSRKSILKRDAHSFDEYRQGLLGCPDRSMLDRKAKSFEEREQEYERAKRRIFKDMEHDSIEQFWHNWSNSNSGAPDQYKFGSQKAQNNRLLKVQSSSMDTRYDGRPSQVGKSHSFGGYGPPSHGRLTRGDSVNSNKSAVSGVYAKQDSGHSQQTWRISQPSSGYKSQSQSVRSESITPSPSYGSVSGEHTPEPVPPVTASGVVWAVTDMASVPKGSVLIDPQTLQPIVNQDGTIYHFDPTNLPQCNKLQIVATSPTSTTPTTSSPTCPNDESAQNRNKFMPKPNTVRESDDDDGGGGGDGDDVGRESPNVNCDNDGSSSNVIRNNSNPEIEISSLPCNESDNIAGATDKPHTDAVNTLLAPIEQIHADNYINSGADNESDDASSERCPSSTSFCNADVATTIVQNRSTSPNMPDASIEAVTEDSNQYTKPDDHPDEIVECDTVFRSPSVDVKDNNSYGTEASTMRPATKCVKLATESPISTEYGKKDEIKMMPAVLPVLSYAAAPAPNVYPAIESGIQMYPGTQSAPTAYPTTTYQQGLDGSVYAVSQPMIYGYPAPMENEYPSIFLPMYDQSMQSANAQSALMPASAAPPTPSSSTMYPPTGATTMAVLPYGASPNYYPGQVIYTSDQYNPANSTATPPQQYINFPIGYTTYPYNGSPAYPAYWGQTAMTYYVPQPMPSAAHAGTNSVLPSPSANGPNNNQLIGPPLLHIASHNTNSSNNNNNNSNINSSNNNNYSQNTSSRNNTPITKTFNSSSSSSTSSNIVDNSNHIVSQQKTTSQISQNAHGNNTPTVPPPIAYTPSPSADNKMTNYSGPSQPNVFQYPCAVTAASTSSYGNTPITSTVTGSGTQTPNQPAMIPAPGRPHFSNSPSATTSTEASPSIAPAAKTNPYNVGPNAHALPSPSTHNNPKNNPPLFPTPSNILTNGIVPHIHNQDYHDAGNNGSTYERKKNQQNSNRKTYSNGSYRPIPGSNYNSQSIHPSSSGAIHNPRKPALMPQPIEQNAQQSFNASAQHNGNRTPPTAVAYSRHNSNNSQAEHNDKRPPMNTNTTRNNSHASGSGHVMHGKGAPLIPTLPFNAHTSNTFDQRPRGPRPKPLDLRRSTNSSTRNTPSTNSTESNNNNSPNSIVSHSIHHAAHQTPLYISRGAHPSVHHSTANALEAAACSSLAYNPHSGMYVKLGGQAYITHSMAFPNKPHQNDVRQQQLQPLTGIYPTMNMMLTGFPQATRPLGPRPSHVNPNYKGRTPR